MRRFLPAAAISKGMEVDVSRATDDSEIIPFTIEEVHNSTPRVGQILWIGNDGKEFIVGAGTRIEVLSFPE